MDLDVRPITESEIDAFRFAIARGFGDDLHENDSAAQFAKVFEIDRTVAAFDGTELIGTGAAFTLDLTVPGGTLPMGGTTIITVQPTHRRRGVLRAMMTAHLQEIRGRGEPLAGLWASESQIYGRFGYGLAAEGYETKVNGKSVQFTGEPPPGVVRLAEPDDAARLLPEIYERVRPRRPGMLSRSGNWWEHRLFRDPAHHRRGRTAKRYAVYHGASGPEGYVTYRQKEKWDDFPEGEVYILELVTATADAHAALWRFVTRIDLFPIITYWNLPVDDELPWRVTEGRRVRREILDSLWLRLIDVGRALEGRHYASAGRLVIGIEDRVLPENDGCYELEASPDGARCRRSSADPDLQLAVDTLGALYLGAPHTTSLARAGLIRGDPDAIATLERLMAWSPLPWCPEVF